jgi:G patch domain/KOW motif-containing protein
MKFSLQLQSKPSSKPKPIKTSSSKSSSSKQLFQYITQFDASETPKPTNQTTKTPIIPPIQNEWRPHKKMKNLEAPISSSAAAPALTFEAATDAHPDPDSTNNISYGLNLRPNSKSKSNTVDEDNERPRSNNNNNNGVENMLLQKLKDDLERLPEDRGLQEFDDVAVEGFGEALLAGYGWYKGRGIGKNAKEDVEVVQYNKRTDKHGLGFVTSTDDHHKAKRSWVSVGKEARVVAGRDVGLKGRIVKVLESKENVNVVVLELSKSQEKVQVSVEQIAELGSKEEEKCLNKLLKDSKRKREETTTSTSSSSSRAWLKSHIRVKIISKEFKGGRLYLKKGEVVDVVGPKMCDVSMDESRELIQGVSQDFLETVLPRRGGPVLVLNGKHQGVFGNLVNKDLDQETAVVQDANTHDLLNVRLHQIAEYIGDPTYLGY